MSSENARDFVLHMYAGQSWKCRVQKMSDSQIYAIYKREKEKEEQEKLKKQKEQQERKDLPF